MSFPDFHHHHKNTSNGVYNLCFNEEITDRFFSVGIHPADARNSEDHIQKLEFLAALPNCAAIGECGLDALVPVEQTIQEEVFARQIALANQLKKPLIIHCVRRFQELISFRKMAEVPMIIHGFNKKQTVADEMLQHNFHLSFGRALLQNVSLQETFRKVPDDRFFLETDDAVFNIRTLYEKAAELKECSTEDILNQIFKNFQSVTNGKELARKN